jgi:transposase
MQRWQATGSIAARPTGGSASPLEDHAEFLLDLVAGQPDLTLDEIVTTMAKAGIAGSRTAVWRFFERHEVTFKKTAIRQRAKPTRRGSRALALHPPAAPAGLHRFGVSG